MKRSLHGYVVVCAVFLLHSAAAWAQVDRATLTGTVKDPQDAVIPKAQVTITNLATNVVARVTTNEEGTYLALNLLPGEYLVQVEATGFQKFEQMVSMSIGTRARLDVSLPLGSVGEMITVAGVTPLLSTESAVLGTVVTNTEVSKLPLAIRNWDDCWPWSPACRATVTPNRPAARRPAVPAASASTAIAACRTTSCSTVSPTTASRPTCRN